MSPSSMSLFGAGQLGRLRAWRVEAVEVAAAEHPMVLMAVPRGMNSNDGADVSPLPLTHV